MKNDAIVNGVRPRRGLYLVNKAKGKVYGVILRVRGSGNIVWQSRNGVAVETDYDNVHKYGYEYVTADEAADMVRGSHARKGEIVAKIDTRGKGCHTSGMEHDPEKLALLRKTLKRAGAKGLTMAEMVKRTGIGERSVYRYLPAIGAQPIWPGWPRRYRL